MTSCKIILVLNLILIFFIIFCYIDGKKMDKFIKNTTQKLYAIKKTKEDFTNAYQPGVALQSNIDEVEQRKLRALVQKFEKSDLACCGRYINLQSIYGDFTFN